MPAPGRTQQPPPGEPGRAGRGRRPGVLDMAVTSDGQAAVGDIRLPVSAGADPLHVLARRGLQVARAAGEPVRATLTYADGRRSELIFTPAGYVGERAQPRPSAAPADPDTVHTWPRLYVTVTREGSVFLTASPPLREGRVVIAGPHNPPPDLGNFDQLRRICAAAGAAAARYIHTQLNRPRPVRGVGILPDGSAWPLIFHPDGNVTSGGEVARPRPRRAARPRATMSAPSPPRSPAVRAAGRTYQPGR